MGKKIRVLIVDDSALVSSALSKVLTSDPEIEIMAMAQDPIAAALKIRNEVPDVIKLDAVDSVLPLDKISDAVLKKCRTI